MRTLYPILISWVLATGAAGSHPPALADSLSVRFPAMAIASQLEGTVTLQVDVGADGSVADCRVVGRLHPMLDAAALEAARNASFTPATDDVGHPVVMEFMVTYRHKLP